MADATLKALRKKLGDLEDELDAVTEAKVELEEQVNSLKSELEAARGEDLRAALQDLQERHESELKKAQSAKEELEQALSSKADLEAKIAALQEAVTSPVAADAASGSLADERAQNEKLLSEVRELTARNDALEEQLAKADGDQRSELQEALEQERQRRQSLETELRDLRRARDDLDDVLEKSRAERQADGAECERLSRVCQELESDRDMALERMQSAERLAAAKSANLEEMQSARATEAARADSLAKELEVQSAKLAQLQAELQKSTQAHVEEQRKASDLQEQLTAYVGTHQELFTRFQTAVEQLDTEKDMRKKVVSERDDLIKTRDEIARARDEIARALELERDKAEQERMHAEQARKELAEAEPPGPAQLTVNDVLISVCFEEVKGAPLEVKPWDTNFEEVVSSWLQAAQRSQNLQSSLVRYLKHLEDTSSAFPLRQDAKLLEVHEQFADAAF